jgi:hypothetical protein
MNKPQAAAPCKCPGHAFDDGQSGIDYGRSWVFTDAGTICSRCSGSMRADQTAKEAADFQNVGLTFPLSKEKQ